MFPKGCATGCLDFARHGVIGPPIASGFGSPIISDSSHENFFTADRLGVGESFSSANSDAVAASGYATQQIDPRRVDPSRPGDDSTFSIVDLVGDDGDHLPADHQTRCGRFQRIHGHGRRAFAKARLSRLAGSL